LTHVTVCWEASCCVLVWPRLARPIVLAIAAGVHLGIGAFLGMWTFGLAMLIGNASFVSPWVVRRITRTESEFDSAETPAAEGAAKSAGRESRSGNQSKRKPAMAVAKRS